MTNEDKQRIEKEAEVYTVSVESRGCSFWQGMYRGYVAGATAELERSEKILQQANDMVNSAHSYTEGAEVPKDIVDRMFNAQFGGEEACNIIEAHMREYFERWPNYKDRLTHLEWYHLFLDFYEKINTENESLKQSLRELIEISGENLPYVREYYRQYYTRTLLSQIQKTEAAINRAKSKLI